MIKFGESMNSRLKVTNISKAMPISNGVEKCSQEKTYEECQIECRIETIQKSCNCTPSNYPIYTLSTYYSCSLKTFEHCKQIINRTECNCPWSSCSYTVYEMSQRSTSIDPNEVKLTLRFRSFSYLSLEEILRNHLILMR